MTRNREHYATLTNENLNRLFMSAYQRSQRAVTNEAWMADEFAMDEIWSVLEARGQQHPCIKNVEFTAA